MTAIGRPVATQCAVHLASTTATSGSGRAASRSSVPSSQSAAEQSLQREQRRQQRDHPEQAGADAGENAGLRPEAEREQTPRPARRTGAPARSPRPACRRARGRGPGRRGKPSRVGRAEVDAPGGLHPERDMGGYDGRAASRRDGSTGPARCLAWPRRRGRRWVHPAARAAPARRTGARGRAGGAGRPRAAAREDRQARRGRPPPGPPRRSRGLQAVPRRPGSRTR